MDGHVRCMVGIAVWGRMYGNREFGGEPGSLLLYIILGQVQFPAVCSGFLRESVPPEATF